MYFKQVTYFSYCSDQQKSPRAEGLFFSYEACDSEATVSNSIDPRVKNFAFNQLKGKEIDLLWATILFSCFN